MSKTIKQYRAVRYDDGKIFEEHICLPTEYNIIGNMIVFGLGELGVHIYEEYDDGTKKEILLADTKLYKNIKSDDDILCLM